MATATASGNTSGPSGIAEPMSGDFASLRLPAHMQRSSVLAAKYQPEGYLAALDRETLWYDAIWSEGRLFLVCPPLNNFRTAFRKAVFRGDDRVLKFRRLRRYARHEVAELDAPNCPAEISVLLQGWTGTSGVSRAAHTEFAGLNTAFVMSRDNPIEWLVTHARYHRDAHGLEALIVMDNGSTAYGIAELRAALEGVGLSRLTVLEVPFKYGPVGRKPYRRTEKYMQTALFNVLRLRFLGQARAVLNCDVDELIVTRGESVFDAACAARLGFVQVAGHWVYPAPGAEGPFSHADHSHTAAPPRPCPPKWCLVPSGRLGGFSWDVHGMERLPFLRRRTHADLSFLHCRSLTTGWKSLKRDQVPQDTVPDPEAAVAAEVLRGMLGQG
ncbi:hypothetical protein PVW47_07645 [Marinovum sp. SP66]|nr:hypothetical protein [Marinovum sp. SP66]MDD9739646.1 hypothetical protein [Marinovum sp. SP66]